MFADQRSDPDRCGLVYCFATRWFASPLEQQGSQHIREVQANRNNQAAHEVKSQIRDSLFINHNSWSSLIDALIRKIQHMSAIHVHQCPAAPVCAPSNTLPANVPIKTETKYPVFIVMTANILFEISQNHRTRQLIHNSQQITDNRQRRIQKSPQQYLPHFAWLVVLIARRHLAAETLLQPILLSAAGHFFGSILLRRNEIQQPRHVAACC